MRLFWKCLIYILGFENNPTEASWQQGENELKFKKLCAIAVDE